MFNQFIKFVVRIHHPTGVDGETGDHHNLYLYTTSSSLLMLSFLYLCTDVGLFCIWTSRSSNIPLGLSYNLFRPNYICRVYCVVNDLK